MAIFIEHCNNVLNKLRKNPISALETDNTTDGFKVQTAVQRAIARVWNAKQWSFKQTKDTLTLVASTPEYNLPKRVGEVTRILSSLSPYWVRIISEEKFDSKNPNPTGSGNPDTGMMFEVSGVEAQPTSASNITVSSNSAADTTQKVLIRGVVNGEEDVEELSLTGTTPVISTKSFSKIYALTKSAITAGMLTFTSNGAVVTNATMSPLAKTLRLKKLRLFPTPSATGTLTIKHFSRPYIPSQAYDDSGIPERWDYVVEQFAFAMALQPQGQDQINEQTAEFQIAIKMLEDDMASEEKQDSAALIVPNRALSDGPSNYGFVRSSEDGYSFELD